MDPTLLMTQAASKLKKESSWLARWKFNGYEEIAELFFNAGNLFKLKKSWNEAIDAYTKAHDCYIKDDLEFDANKCDIEIIRCSRHINTDLCKIYTTKVINNYIIKGDFYNAGIHQENLAIMFREEDCPNEAITEYETAIEYYDVSDKKSSSTRCRLQVGDLYSIQGFYDKAVPIFKTLALGCLNDNFLKYMAQRYCFKACIVSILLCDIVSTTRLLNEFIDLDFSFRDSYEHRFLLQIINSYQESDIELFTASVKDFNSCHTLDNWHVTLLLRIKTKIIETNIEDSLL